MFLFSFHCYATSVLQKRYTRVHPVIVGLDCNYPPFEFVDKGKVTGYDAEVISTILSRLGVSYAINADRWDSVGMRFGRGEISLVTIVNSMTSIEPFRRSIPFSSYYHVALYRRGTSPVYTLRDLSEKHVAVQIWSVPSMVLHRLDADKYATQVSDMPKTIEQFSKGKYDVVISVKDVANYIIRKRHLTNLQSSDLGMPPDEICFASLDTMLIDAVNRELTVMKTDGTLVRLQNKWFNQSEENRLPKAMYYIFLVVVIAFLITYIAILFLRRNARKLRNIYKTMFNSALVGMCLYDKDGRLININDAGCIMYGISDKVAILRSHFNIYDNPSLRPCLDKHHPRAFNGVVSFDTSFMKGRSYFSGDALGVRKHHQYINPIYKDKKFNGYVVLSVDVTEMEIMKEQLNDSVLQTRFAIKSANLMQWEYDTEENRLVCVNETLPVTGMQTLEDARKYHAFIHPADVEAFEKGVLGLMQSRENKTFRVDLRIRYGDGKWHYCFMEGFPLEVDKSSGQVLRYVGFRHDISDVIELNNELHDYADKVNYILKQSDVHLWQYDVEKKVIHLTQTYDFSSVTEITLERLLGILSDEDSVKEKNLHERIASGYDKPFSHIRCFKPGALSDKTEYIIVNGYPVKDDSGRVVSYFGLIRMVTPLIEVQVRLEQERERVQQADRLKSAFIANMSHDIRMPLGAIVGFSTLLEEAETKEEKMEYFSAISKNNDELLSIINTIMDLSQIESGTLELHRLEADLAQSFRHILFSLRGKVPPGVRFIEDNPYKSCLVTLDITRLSQVLVNLADNAFRRTRSGYVKVGYYTEGPGLRFYVEDTDTSLSDEQRKVIFEQLQRAKAYVPDLGLDLAIAKAIVSACQGKIGANPAVDGGIVFWFWLPLEAHIVS